MKYFNSEKFRQDLVALRGEETQDKFAERLGINRSTLSLLETGKQIPALDLFSRICALGGKKTDNYFTEASADSLLYLMGTLDQADREKLEEMSERIRIKEKYELLAKRGNHG